jgi:hypothetical protein
VNDGIYPVCILRAQVISEVIIFYFLLLGSQPDGF